MSEVTEYKPGTFCWPELIAADAGKAKDFYTRHFGWEIKDAPIGDNNVYSMAYLKDKEAGALYQMWPNPAEQGVPTHWGSYVSVTDVNESAEKTESLGATIVMQPTDVFDAGKMAMLIDPTGSVFSLWQPMDHIGARIVNEHGTLVWNELMTKDTEKAKEFYTELFGWTAEDTDMGGGVVYTVFTNDDRQAAGMMAIGEDMADMHPVWAVYFAVDNCDGIVEEAKSLGANVIVAPTDIPEVGRFAYMSDSQGAVFAVIKLLKQTE